MGDLCYKVAYRDLTLFIYSDGVWTCDFLNILEPHSSESNKGFII